MTANSVAPHGRFGNRMVGMLLVQARPDPVCCVALVRPERMRDGIHARVVGQFNRGLPQRFRQLSPLRLGASKLLQLALQLHDWFRNRYAFTVRYQLHLGD